MISHHINYKYLFRLSFISALGGFLFGYDTAVISGTVSSLTQQFSLTSLELGWYVGSALMGSIIGVLFAGILSDIVGRKKTMLISAVLFTISALGCAVSEDFSMLIIFRIIGGLGIGVVSIVSPIYISELSPACHRGKLVSLYQFAITLGFLGAFVGNFILLKMSSQFIFDYPLFNLVLNTEIWRGMLGLEAVPALLFFIMIFFIPESPRWLILKQKENTAKKIINTIFLLAQDSQKELKQIKEHCKNRNKSDISLLFKPGIIKAILIGSSIAILGQFMGINAVLYYGPSIFENAGISGGNSLMYQVFIGLVNAVTTVLGLMIIDKIGRKQLVYYGVSGMFIALILIGIYFYNEMDNSLYLLSIFLIYVFCSAISICTVIFVLLSEMYPSRIRGQAMSVAGFSLWIGTYLIGQLTPWMLVNLSQSGTFFLFSVMCLPYLFIVAKYVPETAGRTLEEIEEFWDNND